MEIDNNFLEIDRSKDIKYPEQSAQFIFLSSGIMQFGMAIPKSASLMAKLDEKNIENNLLLNIEAYTEMGRDIGRKNHYANNPFEADFITALREMNSPWHVANCPSLVFSMNIDFDAGIDLRRIVSNFDVRIAPQIDRVSFTCDEITGLRKPQKFKKLDHDISHISRLFAFGVCCENNPLISRMYQSCVSDTTGMDGSFGESVMFYQNYLVRKKLPYFALENDISLLVNTSKPKSDCIFDDFNLVQDIPPVPGLIYSKASITNPMRSIIAFINGNVLDEYEQNRMSTLGNIDINDHTNREFTAPNMRILKQNLTEMSREYNAKYPFKDEKGKIISLPSVAPAPSPGINKAHIA